MAIQMSMTLREVGNETDQKQKHTKQNFITLRNLCFDTYSMKIVQSIAKF